MGSSASDTWTQLSQMPFQNAFPRLPNLLLSKCPNIPIVIIAQSKMAFLNANIALIPSPNALLVLSCLVRLETCCTQLKFLCLSCNNWQLYALLNLDIIKKTIEGLTLPGHQALLNLEVFGRASPFMLCHIILGFGSTRGEGIVFKLKDSPTIISHNTQ